MKRTDSDCGRRAGERGLSFVEMAVASAVIATLMGAVLSLIATGERSVETGITRTRLEGQARQALETIANELRGAQLQAFPEGNNLNQKVAFKRRYGRYGDGSEDFDLQAGSILWDQLPLDTINLEPKPGELANGIDDDGNGLVDEQDLSKQSNGRAIVICRNVAPGGLTFRLVTPRKLEISLRLEALDGRKNRITVDSSTLVFLRN